MLKMTAEKVVKLKGEGKDNFSAKNDSQSFNAVTLSVVYGEVWYIIVYLFSNRLVVPMVMANIDVIILTLYSLK